MKTILCASIHNNVINNNVQFFLSQKRMDTNTRYQYSVCFNEYFRQITQLVIEVLVDSSICYILIQYKQHTLDKAE